MFRIALISITALAFISGAPGFAKEGGGKGGGGGKGSQGNGNGGGNSRGSEKSGGAGRGNDNAGKKGGPDAGRQNSGADTGNTTGAKNGGLGDAGLGSGGSLSGTSSTAPGGGAGGSTGGLSGGNQPTGNSSKGGIGISGGDTSRPRDAISSSLGVRRDAAPAPAPNPAASEKTPFGSLPSVRRAPVTVLSAPIILRRELNAGDSEPRLPASLAPVIDGLNYAVASFGQPLMPQPGVPSHVVQLCRTSVVRAALPYGAVRVDAASAGRLSRTRDGGATAPIEVRVEYARANARQVRQSRIACQLSAEGLVVAFRE